MIKSLWLQAHNCPWEACNWRHWVGHIDMRDAWSDTVSLNNSPVAIVPNDNSTHVVLEVQALRTLESCQVVDSVLLEWSCSRIICFVLLGVLFQSLTSYAMTPKSIQYPTSSAYWRTSACRGSTAAKEEATWQKKPTFPSLDGYQSEHSLMIVKNGSVCLSRIFITDPGVVCIVSETPNVTMRHQNKSR